MTYESLMNNNFYLATKASSQNEIGEYTYTYTNQTTPNKCRMVPISDRYRLENQGFYDDVKYTCFCLSSSSIEKNSRILYNGKHYNVKEMYMDSSFHHKKALLIEAI